MSHTPITPPAANDAPRLTVAFWPRLLWGTVAWTSAAPNIATPRPSGAQKDDTR